MCIICARVHMCARVCVRWESFVCEGNALTVHRCGGDQLPLDSPAITPSFRPRPLHWLDPWTPPPPGVFVCRLPPSHSCNFPGTSHYIASLSLTPFVCRILAACPRAAGSKSDCTRITLARRRTRGAKYVWCRRRTSPRPYLPCSSSSFGMVSMPCETPPQRQRCQRRTSRQLACMSAL